MKQRAECRKEASAGSAASRPLLSVVVPVYGGADTIVGNVQAIHEAVAPAGDVELVVVSDGSMDETADRLLEAEHKGRVRVIHYDRNLGKGYAVKLGALAAHGDWIALCDADMDLDPASIPAYLEIARAEHLDLAIGSKRHPDSVVSYPRSRRVASWCYQQLNRFLFRLDVRDTQVGLKVFSREIAEQVLPLLLVKQFAFDLELLAVAHALGYKRVRELPVHLDYQFTGSGVGSVATLHALMDTAAIFYRLRVLRTYQRKQRMLRLHDRSRSPDFAPLVSLVGGDAQSVQRLDYPHLETIDGADRLDACRRARGSLVAVISPGARPAGNWVASAAAFFVRPEVAAVVTPEMAPAQGTIRQRAAAAVLESRLGGGSRRFRFSPGNLKVVVDFPAHSVVARREDYLGALEAGVSQERLVSWLTGRGREVVYTPETIVVETPPPLFGPHFRAALEHGRARGEAARRSRGRSLSLTRLLSLLPVACGLAGLGLVLAGASTRTEGAVLLLVYLALGAMRAARAALRFRSPAVGLLAVPG
ncbi:MAG: glycosyltransferase, partial [Gaiellaceae bacterium]